MLDDGGPPTSQLVRVFLVRTTHGPAGGARNPSPGRYLCGEVGYALVRCLFYKRSVVTGFLFVINSTHFVFRHTFWYELFVYSSTIDEVLLFVGNYLHEFDNVFTPLRRLATLVLVQVSLQRDVRRSG